MHREGRRDGVRRARRLRARGAGRVRGRGRGARGRNRAARGSVGGRGVVPGGCDLAVRRGHRGTALSVEWSRMATRILFVEDEPSISDPFSKALVREGFEPVVARTGKEALALAERIDPDLVLLDLALPDTDGRDVARELRRRGNTPIVMLTARGTEMDKIVGLEIGADDYVVKPFSGAEVIARIRAVLRRSRAQRGEAPSEPVQVGDLTVDFGARRVTLDGAELDLSRKEYDLLA